MIEGDLDLQVDSEDLDLQVDSDADGVDRNEEMSDFTVLNRHKTEKGSKGKLMYK